MQEENMGTAMVTPASARAYCSARLPKKMQNPENMAKPYGGRLLLQAHADVRSSFLMERH